MAESRLTLKKSVSSKTLAKIKAQKVLKDKANLTELKQPSSNLKSHAPLQSPISKKHRQAKEPLTENELRQIRAKHEAIERVFTLLLERFPNAFDLEDCKPLHVPLPHLQALFEGEFSKTVVRRAYRKYVRHEAHQHAILDHCYRYNLAGFIAGEITAKDRTLAQERINRIEKRNAKRKGD